MYQVEPFIIKIDKKEHHIDPTLMLKIDKDNLDNELITLPGQFGWIASLRAIAYAKHENCNNKYKIEHANSYDTVLNQYEKKPTEKAIEAEMRMNSQYETRKKLLVKLKREFDLLDGLLQALRHKKDMLQTISSNMRHEYNNQ